jgi:hypothetical protein
MDELKKYLHEQRDKLDVEPAPSTAVWEQIQQQSAPVRKPVFSLTARWIAAASIIIVAGLAIILLRHSTPVKPDVADKTEQLSNPNPESPKKIDTSIAIKNNPPAIVETDNHKSEPIVKAQHKAHKQKKVFTNQVEQQSPLDEMETSYSAIINHQLKQLESTPIYAESPDYFHVFKKQWYDLEKDEQKIKGDLKTFGFTDNMIEELLNLYKQKLLLLKQLQNEINKMNNRVKQIPGVQQNNPSYLKM